MVKPVFHLPVICMMNVFVVLAACNSKPSGPSASTSEAATLVQVDAMLHNRLQAVLDADQAFSQSVSASSKTDVIDSQNAVVTQAEIALKKTIDSLKNRPVKNSVTAENSIAQLTTYFEALLQSRRTAADLRMALSATSDDSTAMQQQLAGLRATIQERDKKIASLEQAGNSPLFEKRSESAAAATEPNSYAPAKGDSPADLKQRNRNLALAYSSLQNKYFVVGRDYLLLKQEHERTLQELAALRKAGN